ncbi:type VI secretion system tip protein VgrG [Pseudoduganella armeniaca]|uniref:Type VI secretion system tip protein VgrG n=2 Tax=Pseudoduganella armeniaca TaxID=2072590 RepID=A0A2R4CHN2_9BURK|nr:type VI secretion system tip protein VgrG [Pseudoduganella armeniaca]
MVANRLDAVEGLSRSFRYEVEVLSDDSNISLKDVLGKMVTVELVREDGSLRYFNGYVFEFRRGASDGGLIRYTMILEPWLAYLRLRRDNFLFHGKTIADQTEEIFRDYEVRDVELRITKADPILTFSCQYDESDYNYVHRRWEELGWYYWYEHRADGHTLVISDDSVAAPALDGERTDIPYQSEAGTNEDDGLSHWEPVRIVRPSSVVLSSFDFKAPRPTMVDLPTVNEQGTTLPIETYDYAGAYGYKNLDDADRRARVRLEEIEATAKYFEGRGNDRTAQPGRKFTLSGHFDTTDLDFLILQAHHHAENNYQSGETGESKYENQILCSRVKVPWRPGRGFNSTEPKIHGLQTAIVTGPAGEEIYTDEYGRIRAQFHWDRAGENDDRSSAWLRVSTAWAGSSFGMTTIPRIGTEVIVQFLDGNPDRPIVTGMVPNEVTMPPWPLPANKTQSGILSRSSPGGTYENANAIRFEDKKGAEQLWLHAEKDQLTEVEHDEDKWVGNDRRKKIDRDEQSHIGRDRTEIVDHDEAITVHNNRKEQVDNDETVDIGRNRTKTIGKNRKDEIGKNWSTYVHRFKTETIGMAYLQNVGMGRMENVGLAYNLNVGTVMATVVGINQITRVGKAISITAGDELTITVGMASIRMTSDGNIFINGSQIGVHASGPMELTGKDVDIN